VHPEEDTLYVQIVLHYFTECPIPAGPFGFDANLVHLVFDVGIGFDSSLLWGADRLGCDPSDVLRVRQFMADARPVLSSAIDEWALSLEADPMLRRGAEMSNSLKAGEAVTLSYEDFVLDLSRFGIESQRGYPVRKVASHAYRRAIGDKSWWNY
jgi:hypothetical protein